VILNKGFATAAWSRRSRDIFEYDYGWESVWASVSSPGEAVERYGGWSQWIRTQILPLTAGTQEWKWAPNYFGHIMEGGIVFRRVTEWYEAAGMPWPTFMGAVTTYGAAVINEAYESPGATLGKGSTVGDLLIFDPASILIFSSDRVARFFAHNLRSTVWPQQGSIRVDDGFVVNNAEHLIFKLPVPTWDRTRLFLKGGLGMQFGLTRSLSNGLDVSASFGKDAKRQHIDPVTGRETVDFELSAGFFVDLDNNLLWSLYWSERSDRRLTLNIYPGVITSIGVNIGLWAVLESGGSVSLGLSTPFMMGLGLGTGF
jgi:hypothetical protein